MLFEICGVETKPEWLLIPFNHWEKFEDFRRMKEFAENLPVTNNTAARAILSYFLGVADFFLVPGRDKYTMWDR